MKYIFFNENINISAPLKVKNCLCTHTHIQKKLIKADKRKPAPPYFLLSPPYTTFLSFFVTRIN